MSSFSLVTSLSKFSPRLKLMSSAPSSTPNNGSPKSSMITHFFVSTTTQLGKLRNTTKASANEQQVQCHPQQPNLSLAEKTISILKLASELGISEAQYTLGRMYQDGLFVEKDDSIAVLYFAKAAARELAESEFVLAQCLMDGKGAPFDKVTALDLLKSAAAKGHKDALLELGKWYQNGSSEENESLALFALLKASSLIDVNGDNICFQLIKKKLSLLQFFSTDSLGTADEVEESPPL